MCVMCAKIISNIVIFAICNCNLKTKFTRCVYGKRFTLKLKIIFKKKNKLKFMKLKKEKYLYYSQRTATAYKTDNYTERKTTVHSIYITQNLNIPYKKGKIQRKINLING